MGTDIQVFENEKDKAQVHLNPLAHYKPNLHFECHDRLLGGDIGLSTKNNEISYTKLYEVQGLELGVSALFNYAERVPYAGFVLHSTSGVSSAAKSNAFSINHSMDLDFMPVDTKLQFQGEVALPGTKFDTKTGTVGLTVRPRAARAHRVTDACGRCTGPGGRQVPQSHRNFFGLSPAPLLFLAECKLPLLRHIAR